MSRGLVDAIAVNREQEPSDEELVRRIREGDEVAFRECCDRYRKRLMGRIGRELPAALRGKVSAVDVLQDAYLVAWRRIGELEGAASGDVVGRWLGRVVDLKVREVVRHYLDVGKREVGREWVPEGSEAGMSGLETGPTPSQVAVAGELREAASRAWVELPENYREVLRLVREEGLSMARAAERMGAKREVTKKLYGRAVARFSMLIAKYGGPRP